MRGALQMTTIPLALALVLGTARAQPAPGPAPAPAVDGARLQKRLALRKAALDRQELRRLQFLDRLEFGPVKLPPRFPRLCFVPPSTPASAIDPNRSLFVHDRSTLDALTPGFSLRRTLDQIAGQVAPTVPGTTAVSIFRQLWDTQNAAPGVTSGPHCSDDGGTLNGFPITCPRNEGQEALGTDAAIESRISEYAVLALVNRLDLAHQGWRNCGEHRIVYGKRGAGFAKNLIIFEAVLPNPRPGCREGCVPVAQLWKSLSAIDDPVLRAQKLQELFYGDPAPLPGFRAVVHVDHYSASGVSTVYGSSGSGQIRTNQFLQTPSFQPWLLKEFKTVIDCGVSPCAFAIVPISVKVNPHGPLWNQDNPDPRAADFQADTLAQTAALASGSLTGIGYAVDLANDAGQSMSLAGAGFVDNYRDQMNSAAATSFRIALAAGSLTSDQMANRALTQSCAGCHQPSTFGLNVPNSIGPVLTPVGSPVPSVDAWPDVVPAGFVHVDVPPASVRPELAANPAAFGSGLGQVISPALLDFFLPERKRFLLEQLDAARCLCLPRFRFLAVAERRRALEVEARVQRGFKDRFDALERRLLEAQVTRPAEKDEAGLLEERARLVAERDRAIGAELARARIKLPDPEVIDLRPRPMKLEAGRIAKGDARRASALRVQEVNRILRQEPPRKTVTGSFRAH